MLRDFYRALFERFGPQKWWPAETPFEVIIGAILTQNTSWTNVEKAISRLQMEGFLDPLKLSTVPFDTLSELLRPAGYYRVKAGRLLNFMAYFQDRYDLDIHRMQAVDTHRLREEFLAIKGIGPETADSILLYAFSRPVFVVDSYTRRVLSRHRLIDAGETYPGIQGFLMTSLQENVRCFNEYHALLVRVGKVYCRTEARCEGCPLEPFLGERTPVPPSDAGMGQRKPRCPKGK